MWLETDLNWQGLVLIDTNMPPQYLPFWSLQDKLALMYNLCGHEATLSLQFDQLSLTHLTFTRCISIMPKHSWLWNGYKLCILTLIQNPLTLCTIYWYYRYSDLIYHKFSCPANKKIFDLIIRNKNQNGINSTSFIENLFPCYLPCKIFIFKLPY